MSLTPQFGSITPSQKQEVLASNFLVFDNATDGTDTFAAQYLPEMSRKLKDMVIELYLDS